MGIEAANTCVVCLSNEFIKSKVCGDEIEHMLKHHKRIVPIVVAQDFNWDDVHPEIAKLNFIFFTPLPDDKTKLHDHLKVKVAELTEVLDRLRLLGAAHARTQWATNGINMAGIAVFFAQNYLMVVDEFIETAKHIATPQPSQLMKEFFQESKKVGMKEKKKRHFSKSY